MIVKVFRTAENGGTFMGTAFFAGPGRLVTCAHVAVDEKMLLKTRDDRDLGLAERKKQGEWRSEADPREEDWAVLKMIGTYRCATPLSVADARNMVPWRAEGFGVAAPQKRTFTLSGLIKTVGPLLEMTCTETVDPDFHPGGASGSPIEVDGQVVGILVSGLPGDAGVVKGCTLYAVALNRVPYIEAHLEVQRDARVKAMCRWLRRQLSKELIEVLDYGESDPVDVADKLVDESADALLLRLRRVAAELKADGDFATLKVLQRIALRLAPMAVDWKYRTYRGGDTRRIELQVYTRTLAELIVAGVDGRAVDFDSDGGSMSHGARSLNALALLKRVRPEPDSDGANDGTTRMQSLLVDATIHHLTGFFKFDKYGEFSDEQQLGLLENELRQQLKEAGAGMPTPFYLVFDEPSELWKGARRAFDARLPSLRLVCLSGDNTSLTAEQNVARLVHAILFADPRNPA